MSVESPKNVVVQPGRPSSARWEKQHHARKNHSYFLVFRRGAKGPRGKHKPKSLAFFQKAGARGGKIGGSRMTAQERKERARQAAAVRWAKA
jgi:hypothetical protein